MTDSARCEQNVYKRLYLYALVTLEYDTKRQSTSVSLSSSTGLKSARGPSGPSSTFRRLGAEEYPRRLGATGAGATAAGVAAGAAAGTAAAGGAAGAALAAVVGRRGDFTKQRSYVSNKLVSVQVHALVCAQVSVLARDHVYACLLAYACALVRVHALPCRSHHSPIRSRPRHALATPSPHALARALARALSTHSSRPDHAFARALTTPALAPCPRPVHALSTPRRALSTPCPCPRSRPRSHHCSLRGPPLRTGDCGDVALKDVRIAAHDSGRDGVVAVEVSNYF